jgi:hypothetical protein
LKAKTKIARLPRGSKIKELEQELQQYKGVDTIRLSQLDNLTKELEYSRSVSENRGVEIDRLIAATATLREKLGNLQEVINILGRTERLRVQVDRLDRPQHNFVRYTTENCAAIHPNKEAGSMFR